MNETEIRQAIINAENELEQLDEQYNKLEVLATNTADTLNRINRDGEPAQIMTARIERDAASAMLEDNEAAQQAMLDRIQALTAQAKQASLDEAAAAALTALEDAKNSWRLAAGNAAETYLQSMADIETEYTRITEAYRAAQNAARAATGSDTGVNSSVSWAGLPGVNFATGGVTSESGNMTMNPPQFRDKYQS